jgi:hypothetical protein
MVGLDFTIFHRLKPQSCVHKCLTLPPPPLLTPMLAILVLVVVAEARTRMGVVV